MKPALWLHTFNASGRLNARSLVIYKNIIQSVVIKGVGILISFLTVPLTLRYISVGDFGIWMTITFLTSWFSLVDVSFGNGLRNSLVLFFNNGDTKTARNYVSTLYALSAAIALVLVLLILTIGHYVNWAILLNIHSAHPGQVNDIITYTLISFSLQLLLKPINSILLADQKTALTGWILLLINGLVMIAIYVGARFTTQPLLTIAHIYNLTPLIVLGLVSLYFLSTTYARIAPGFGYIDLSLSKELFSIGGQFFILQLVSILVFTSGGLFISYFLGSDSVAPYSIASKYFSVITVLYSVIITPYWSAFTDAYIKHDKLWIRHTLRQLNYISTGMSALAIAMLLVANMIFNIWIGSKVTVSWKLSASLTLYSISYVFLSNYNSFLNGIGHINRLVYASLIGSVLYVLLNIVLFRGLGAGPASVVIAGTIWNVALLLVCLVEYRVVMASMPAPTPSERTTV